MDNDLIGQVFRHFIDSRSAVERAIIGQRNYLQRMADQGKLTEAYASVMNTLLGSMAMHMEAMDDLLGLIGLHPGMDTEAFARDYRTIADVDQRRQQQLYKVIRMYEDLEKNYNLLAELHRGIAESDQRMTKMLYKRVVEDLKKDGVTGADLKEVFSNIDDEERRILEVIYHPKPLTNLIINRPKANSHEVRTSSRNSTRQKGPDQTTESKREGNTAAA